MKKIKLKTVGLAIEAFGATITASAVGSGSMFWSYVGMLTTGLGRALAFIGKDVE